MKKYMRYFFLGALMIGFFCMSHQNVFATLPSVNIEVGGSEGEGFGQSIQLILLITILALAPSILMMMTCFTRVIIALHFLKSAMGTQQMPPNQIVVGLALFITFFIMSPTFLKVQEVAIKPYQNKQITQQQALERGILPIKEFMLYQTRDEDIKLFMDLSEQEILIDDSNLVEEIPLQVLVPAFIITELRAGFLIGFVIYIPFLVIDMVVASTLMSMGMMMLPPATIALPFKILIFVLLDGWNLIIGQLIQTFVRG
jgi:flagellar biosynthetic protein FliP